MWAVQEIWKQPGQLNQQVSMFDTGGIPEIGYNSKEKLAKTKVRNHHLTVSLSDKPR